MLKDYLTSKNISVYRLSKDSGVPYTTVLELTKNKTNIDNATIGTALKLARTLNLEVNEFIDICSEYRVDFEIFRSNICHLLKSKGDKKFIEDLLNKNLVQHYYDYGWYRESFYLIGMLDYLYKINKINIIDNYNSLREYKLEEILYPKDCVVLDKIKGNDECKNEALKSCIKEFLKYNIVECDVRDVI